MDKEGTVAILAYFSPLGWGLAWLLHRREGSSLGAFHLRQSLGLHVLVMALFPVRLLFFIPYGEPVRALVDLFWAALAVAAVQGVVHAYRRRERPLPLIGEFIQEYLRSLT
ncbi:MAG: hypothetical protein ABEH38_04540 [Flavobacteriales bacterium]